MNPDTAQLLEQLRDIHGAPPAPWWPPAPGWWLLAALVLVLVLWLGRRLLDARRLRQRRQRLLDYLELLPRTLDPQTQPQAFLAAVNGLLKLAAMRAFPGAACATLKGAEWVAFLASHLEPADARPGFEVLAEGPYMPEPRFDSAVLCAAARKWLKRHG